jgi:branched-subunit amino acid aminotransferase/4-amino-4-deoxychorismate lyase
MPELAYLNGNILPIDQAMVPIEDRGYQFGDAVYEYIASYGGKLFFLEEHLDRLERSMAELSFPPVSRDKIRQAIVDLFERSGIERAGLYLQISRGVAPRNHPIPDACRPQVVMTVRPVMDKPPGRGNHHAGSALGTLRHQDRSIGGQCAGQAKSLGRRLCGGHFGVRRRRCARSHQFQRFYC